MKWNIEGTDEFAEWYWRLSPEEQDSVDAAIEKLEEEGPALRRPFSGHIEGSEFHHMKELIPIPGNLRILYAFDPRRTAILLIGGDKTNDWDAWYERTIPEADGLYREYLEELREEGLIQ